jgi:hypothetical protein
LPPSRRLTIRQAADELGTSVVAVLGRVKRGSLAYEREGGRVYVLLDDESRPGRDQSIDQQAELIATLREQLEAEREANRENRRIIAALNARIRELEAPSETKGKPEMGAEEIPMEPTSSEMREEEQEDAQHRS